MNEPGLHIDEWFLIGVETYDSSFLLGEENYLFDRRGQYFLMAQEKKMIITFTRGSFNGEC